MPFFMTVNFESVRASFIFILFILFFGETHKIVRRKLKSHVIVVGVNRNDYDDVFISMICATITLCFMSVT